MDRLDEFQRLTQEWQQAKQAAALAQMALDLKISSFLSGFGEPPTITEQDTMDNLRACEAERRLAMDEFVWEAIQESLSSAYEVERDVNLLAPRVA
jgi:hypothetical protein